MAIGTYAELKTAIAGWSHRVNTITSARAAEFISLYEASANATLRLRDNEIETSLTATAGSSFINLPSNYQAPVFLKVTSTQRALTFTPADQLPYYPSSASSARWTVKDSRIQTERDADSAYAYTLRYHKKFALSDAATTNALLTAYPNVYLYGSLIEAAPFVRDLSVVGLWQARYDRSRGELDIAEAEGRGANIATLSVDPALVARSHFNILTG